MSEWIDCPKCGFNHENQTACPAPVLRSSEIEIPKDVTAAAILISNWMKEQGHDRWELFDLCSRNHAAELERANTKLATLSRLIELAQQCDDSKSETELASSATFSEALALTNADVLEKERDEARSELEKQLHRNRLLLTQQAHEEEVRAQLSHFLAQTQLRFEEWKDIAAKLAAALGNDGIECNNFLTRIVRAAALADYEVLKGK